MILTDKDIKALVESNKLIIEGYDEKNVGSISYDLTIGEIISEDNASSTEYTLNPGVAVFIKTTEKLSIPNEILGRVAQKNSRMRMGLYVDGPHYHPGHETYAFLRVWNISSQIITIKKGQNIAQIMFEQLTQEPSAIYGEGHSKAFVNETEYRGLSSYKDEYEKYIKKIEKANDNIEKKETQIYANVLTLMGIVAAVFAIITLNFQAFAAVELSIKFILTMNLSLVLTLSVFFGLLHIIINKKKKHWFNVVYIVILVLIIAALFVVYFCF